MKKEPFAAGFQSFLTLKQSLVIVRVPAASILALFGIAEILTIGAKSDIMINYNTNANRTTVNDRKAYELPAY